MSAAARRSGLTLRAIRFAGRNLRRAVYESAIRLPWFHFIKETRDYQAPVTFSLWFMQKALGFNRKAYWPVHFTSKIVQPEMIVTGIDANPGIEPGCYIQGLGGIFIGDYTQCAANVGIVSANHDPENNARHIARPVRIGANCWIGFGAVILPGVELGDFTIVGAGAVVTKSFEKGYCVIAGNPAAKIRDLDPARCTGGSARNPYVGYIRQADFAAYRKRKLWL